MASSWPMTRWCSAFSMKTSRLDSSSVSLKTGMPVAWASTSAIRPSSTTPRGADVARLPLLLEAQALAEQVLLLVAQRRGLLEVLVLDRGFLLAAHRGDLLVELAQLRRGATGSTGAGGRRPRRSGRWPCRAGSGR